MRFKRAIVRKPGRDFGGGITTADLGPPDFHRMMEQHQAYVTTLRGLNLEVEVLDSLPGFPDAHFVEDTAVVFDEAAVITRPGAPSRRGETETIVQALSLFRETLRIEAPGTVDGGDVFQVGTIFFIGISDRTNESGARQLGRMVARFGYRWTAVAVGVGLHLKSGINFVGRETVLSTRAFAQHDAIRDFNIIQLEDEESYAANTLLVNDHLITPKGFPRVVDQLARLGMPIIELDMSESRKMDGGLTCLSLRLT